jgi:hypothetical protein
VWRVYNKYGEAWEDGTWEDGVDMDEEEEEVKPKKPKTSDTETEEGISGEQFFFPEFAAY